MTVPTSDPTGGDAVPDADRRAPRLWPPPEIGGLATPWGVRFTTGAHTAGASDKILALTGALMALVHGIALAILLPFLSSLPGHAETFTDVVLILALALVSLAALRFSPAAGYHAAEHQCVHAVERGAPLTRDGLRRQPRAHPRCGSQGIAVLLLLTGAVASTLVIGTAGYLIGGFVTIALRRRFSTWLQETLATRPATDRQLDDALAAMETLLERHAAAPYRHATLGQRLAGAGAPALAAGYALGGLAIYLATFALAGPAALPQLW